MRDEFVHARTVAVDREHRNVEQRHKFRMSLAHDR